MIRALFLLSSCCVLLFTIACSEPPEPEPEPIPPSEERCAKLTTERDCYAAKCAFFANAAELISSTQDPSMCSRGPSIGVCLHADDPDGVEVLTTYSRQLDDGATRVVQLNVDVDVAGWTRCGNRAAPPDCDCDGM